jgi:hypothetical protein
MAGILTYTLFFTPSHHHDSGYLVKTTFSAYSSGNCSGFSPNSLLIKFQVKPRNLNQNYASKVDKKLYNYLSNEKLFQIITQEKKQI